MRKILFLFITFSLLPYAIAGKRYPEKYYQEKWCRDQDGQIEVILLDCTRCDCLTNTHAIEFDFGPKWAESIGQALYHGLQTGKKPGIVLIIENEDQYKYWIRLNSIIINYRLPIDTWILRAESFQGK